MRPVLVSALVALTACVAARTVDGPLTGEGVDPEPLVLADTDEPGLEVQRSTFRWSDERLQLAVSDTLSGASIQTSEVGAWTRRTAGGAGHHRTRGVGAMPSSVGAGRGRMAPMAEVSLSEAPTAGSAMKDATSGRRVDLDQTQGALRAGSTDDNADYDAFLQFLQTWTDRPGVAGNHVPMDVSDRRFVRVLTADGVPAPGARFSIIDRERDVLVWSGTTYGDGRAPFYPHLAGVDGPEGDWIVQADVDGEILTRRWDGDSEQITLQADRCESDDTVDLDVVFVIDTTGSMSDEIARIKQTLLAVTDRVRGLDQEVDLRYGAVLYRDLGDEYLTRHTPLTHDVQAFDRLLQGIQAGGGGDTPESLNQGLSLAVGGMDWRPGAAKLTFLVADAPPHMDYQQDTTYADASRAALARGIRIHTVAASGLDDFGSLVFRQSAQLTRGEFVFIEYGSTAASAADHGVTGSVHSNNLDAILFRKIEAEVEGWGAPAS